METDGACNNDESEEREEMMVRSERVSPRILKGAHVRQRGGRRERECAEGKDFECK